MRAKGIEAGRGRARRPIKLHAMPALSFLLFQPTDRMRAAVQYVAVGPKAEMF